MNEDIVAVARSYLGTRWVHQGRSREGVDCVGLAIQCAVEARGWEVPTPDYSRETQDETMLQMCRRFLLQVSAAGMAPGDIAVFGFQRQRHMGVIGDYVHGGLSVIHAYLPNRKVVEVRLDDVWRGRILSVFRFPEA